MKNFSLGCVIHMTRTFDPFYKSACYFDLLYDHVRPFFSEDPICLIEIMKHTKEKNQPAEKTTNLPMSHYRRYTGSMFIKSIYPSLDMWEGGHMKYSFFCIMVLLVLMCPQVSEVRYE